MKCSWREGNKIQLLENGEQYYPAVFKAIGEAQERIILETFIWFEDDVGKQLHAALLAAAQRGVKAEVLLDGYGSPDLSDEFVNELTAAGVVFRYYDPRPRLFGMRTNVFRRMHRKIVVIDARIAFIGGLNYSAEHMSSYGPEAKQDYAVRLEGPIVEDILQFELENLPGQSAARRWWRRHHKAEENRQPGEAQVLLVWRDNEEHRDDIERHYLKMLTQARREVIIANAYFFPGYRFLHALRKAARRGVRIKLIIQGEPDMPIVRVGARLLYNYPGLIAAFGFCSGVGSFILVDRQQGMARWIAVILLVSWVWLMLENTFTQLFSRVFKREIPEPLLRYATQMIHQESFFFVLPFFFITTTWNSGQLVFTGLLGVCALIAITDPLYYRWLAPRRWLFLALHTLALFAAMLTALPIILNLTTSESYKLALGTAVLLSIPSLAVSLPLKTWRGWLVLPLIVLALGGTISYVAFASRLPKVLTSDAKRISITPKLSSLARAANRTRIIRAGAASVLKKPVGNC